ncbi:MAG: hypothetical protein LBK53_09785 [Heliobacteriaceae bacterium]|jgi:hypothetical protein|nr:hypothetical protein [Heliobacteriaceae bacterium]
MTGVAAVKGQGITYALAKEAGLSDADMKKVDLGVWKEVMEKVKENNNKQSEGNKTYTGGEDVDKLNNSANWKTDFQIKAGDVMEFDETILGKIKNLLAKFIGKGSPAATSTAATSTGGADQAGGAAGATEVTEEEKAKFLKEKGLSALPEGAKLVKNSEQVTMQKANGEAYTEEEIAALKTQSSDDQAGGTAGATAVTDQNKIGEYLQANNLDKTKIPPGTKFMETDGKITIQKADGGAYTDEEIAALKMSPADDQAEEADQAPAGTEQRVELPKDAKTWTRMVDLGIGEGEVEREIAEFPELDAEGNKTGKTVACLVATVDGVKYRDAGLGIDHRNGKDKYMAGDFAPGTEINNGFVVGNDNQKPTNKVAVLKDKDGNEQTFEVVRDKTGFKTGDELVLQKQGTYVKKSEVQDRFRPMLGLEAGEEFPSDIEVGYVDNNGIPQPVLKKDGKILTGKEHGEEFKTYTAELRQQYDHYTELAESAKGLDDVVVKKRHDASGKYTIEIAGETVTGTLDDLKTAIGKHGLKKVGPNQTNSVPELQQQKDDMARLNKLLKESKLLEGGTVSLNGNGRYSIKVGDTTYTGTVKEIEAINKRSEHYTPQPAQKMTEEQFAEYSKCDPNITYIQEQLPKLRAKYEALKAKEDAREKDPFASFDEDIAAFRNGEPLETSDLTKIDIEYMERALSKYKEIIMNWQDGKTDTLLNGSQCKTVTLPNRQKGFEVTNGNLVAYYQISVDPKFGSATPLPGELFNPELNPDV